MAPFDVGKILLIILMMVRVAFLECWKKTFDFRIYCVGWIVYSCCGDPDVRTCLAVTGSFVTQRILYEGFFFRSALRAEMAVTEPNRTLAVTVMLRGLSLILWWKLGTES